MMTRQAALEYGHLNIRVNAVCPGPIMTEMLGAAPQEVRDRLIQAIPMARLGKPSEIGSAVLFLASDDASFVNGAALVVDGGMIIGMGPEMPGMPPRPSPPADW